MKRLVDYYSNNHYTGDMGMPKILIVEDEHLLRQAYEFLFKSEGFEVSSASDGKVGIVKMKKFKPNLVLLDMLMPVMNGMDFLQKSNIAVQLPDSKVIVLSNLSDTVRLRDVKKYNVCKVLLKSNLSPDDLVREVKKFQVVA